MNRKRNTRHAHAFSKGRGVRFTPPGTWRPQAPVILQTQARAVTGAQVAEGGSAKKMSEARRLKYLKVSPTIADLYTSHAGLAVICADCLRDVRVAQRAGLPVVGRRGRRGDAGAEGGGGEGR